MSELHTTAWQAALNDDGIVTDIQDIQQCVQIILQTPKGADALRPDFGCNIWRWVDQPIHAARAHLARDIIDAVLKYEPRIRKCELQNVIIGDSQLSITLLCVINDEFFPFDFNNLTRGAA